MGDLGNVASISGSLLPSGSSAGVGTAGVASTIGGQGSCVARTGRIPWLRAAKSF
jgi:hypothetical protein